MTYDIVKEKREAIEAGKEALEYLYAAKKDLDSARGWGIWDVLGGGFIVSAIKHSKMSDAKVNLGMAKSAIRTFNKELQDVKGELDTALDVGILGTIFDFCDGDFLADLYVQSKINKARTSVDRAIGMIENIIDDLRY